MSEKSKPSIAVDFQAGQMEPTSITDAEAAKSQEAVANPTMTAFSDVIDRFGVDNQEVADRKEELELAGAELIESFGVKPEFFEDESRAAIFTSLAGNHASATKTKETDSWTENTRKKEFVANAAFLLTRNFSTNSEELNALHEKQQLGESGVAFSEGLYGKVMEKYTDASLSKEIMEEATKAGVFTEVLAKLGINEKDATTIKVSVLSTGRYSDDIDFLKEENGVTRQEANEWAKGLEKRAKKAAKELPHMQDIELALKAAGFATTIDGEEHLVIPMAAAEAFLAGKHGVKLDTNWRADRPERVKSLLQHEFTHLQKSTRVEGSFGYTIEERRAEYFSGDRSEYFQEKTFLTNLSLLNGKHIIKLFDEQAELRQAGQEVSIYKMLMDTYGVDVMAQIAAAVPAVYMRYEKSEFMKGMTQNLGTYDQIIAEQARALPADKKQEALARVEQRIKAFSDRPNLMEHVIWQTKELVEALDGPDMELKLKQDYKDKLKSINFQKNK